MTQGELAKERNAFARAMQEALTRDEVTSAYLGSVGGVIPAAAIGLYQLNQESGSVIEVRAKVAVNFLDAYEQYGREDDPVLEHMNAYRRPIDSSRLPSTRWHHCGARDALAEAGLGHSMEAPVMVSGTMFGTINFARPSSTGPFAAEDLLSARHCAEHLGLATERALRFELTGHRASLLENAIDRIPQALVITDLDGRLLFRNRTARSEWDAHDDVDGSITGHDPIRRAIEDATAQFRIDGKRVVTQKVSTARRQQMIVKSFRLADRVDASVTLLFKCAEESEAQRLPAWDVLTRREQEIAQLVSHGLTTRQIAEQAFISENTVKQHLKRVFAKTDVKNRAELVQLIWSSNSGESDPK
jgi:DNA-binding CsgD family transcriptional regulator